MANLFSELEAFRNIDLILSILHNHLAQSIYHTIIALSFFLFLNAGLLVCPKLFGKDTLAKGITRFLHYSPPGISFK